MLTVSDTAREELKRVLESRDLGPGKCLRLAVAPVWPGPGDFGVVIADEGHGDEAVYFEGARVLAVDPTLSDRLAKSVLDFKDSRFTLDVF